MTARRYSLESAKYIVLVVYALVVISPIVWILLQSLKGHFDTISVPPKFLFRPTLENYIEVLSTRGFTSAFLSSAAVAAGSVGICVFIGAPFAYVLTRYRFKGRDDIAFIVFTTRMLPAIVLIVPFIKLFASLRILDTYAGLVVAHVVVNLALVVWMMKGFYYGIPKELEEAAWIDGSSYLGAFFRIIFPVSLPGLVTTAILAFLFSWNELIFAITIAGSRMRTLPVFMATQYTGYVAVDYGPLSAAGLLSFVPTAIFIIVVRKHIVRGLTFGAVN